MVLAGVAGYLAGDPNARGDATDELVGGTVILLGAPLGLLYFVLMRGETVGKRINGIAVRDLRTMERISYGRAFARALVTCIFWIPFYLPGILDGLWALMGPRATDVA